MKYAIVSKDCYLGKVNPSIGPRIAWTEDEVLVGCVLKKFMNHELPILDSTYVTPVDAESLSLRINILTSIKDGFKNIDWFEK